VLNNIFWLILHGFDTAFYSVKRHFAKVQLIKIQGIAKNTVHTSVPFAKNTVPLPGNRDFVGGDATGHCVEWVNLVMNQITKLPGVENKGSYLIFIAEDGTAIAVSFEILDYNGWCPTFASHVVVRVEVGKAHKNEWGNIVFDELTAIIYLDNNLYGGKDRIFDPVNAGKSLLPYPGGNNRTLFDNNKLTPLMWRQGQFDFTNWF